VDGGDHSPVAFAECAKVLFDAVKLLGVEDISVPLAKNLPCPGENPFEIS